MPDSLPPLRSLIASHDIRAVVSDLDGVLRRFDQSLWAELDQELGTEPGTVFTAILRHPYLDDVVRGRGTHAHWRERASIQLVDAGADPVAARAAVDRWAATPAVVDRDVLDALATWRGEGIAVFVLTNGTDRVPAELDALGLGPFLGTDRRFLLNTADLGAAKPDAEAYSRAHDRIEQELRQTLAPSQIAFLDDSLRHVRAAAAFGWNALHHHVDGSD
ncbi:HAD family hydrolase [Brachybacterium sp. GCM10030267]|uniref:HAD family hydrolase n=1 Tax=Brachybacterium sp. GCM10030267 TaxID=3273381 RepID=UPI00360D1F46